MRDQRDERERDAREVSVNLNLTLPGAADGSGEANAPPAKVSHEPRYSAGLGYGLWCAGLVGACGIHRFYVGKVGTGLLWLLTFGLLGIGQIFDLFTMRSLVRDANLREGFTLHPRQLTGAQRHAQLNQGTSQRIPPQSLRQQLLHAAVRNGGELTVTQGVMETGRDFDEIEKALAEMADRGYVDVDNAPGSGVVVYRFAEMRGGRSSG